MELTLADEYFLRADGHYPENLASVVENLRLALGYDDRHAPSWCLLGQVQMYRLADYHNAERAYNEAINCDLNYTITYRYLSLLYVWLEEYERAENLIDYGLSIPGIHRFELRVLLAIIYELNGDLERAEEILTATRQIVFDNEWIRLLDDDINRVVRKQGESVPTRESSNGRRFGRLRRLVFW